MYIYIYIDTYTCANLHPRCRILFYTLAYGLTPKTTHARTPHPHPNQPAFPTRARRPGNRPTPVCDRSLSPSPQSLSTTSLDPLFLRSWWRRFLQGDYGGAGVGGGVVLRRRLGISICTRPFFLPPASISCLLTLSSGSRSQTRLIWGEAAAAPLMKGPKGPCWWFARAHWWAPPSTYGSMPIFCLGFHVRAFLSMVPCMCFFTRVPFSFLSYYIFATELSV
jgi:hypothetical protein